MCELGSWRCPDHWVREILYEREKRMAREEVDIHNSSQSNPNLNNSRRWLVLCKMLFCNQNIFKFQLIENKKVSEFTYTYHIILSHSSIVSAKSYSCSPSISFTFLKSLSAFLKSFFSKKQHPRLYKIPGSSGLKSMAFEYRSMA